VQRNTLLRFLISLIVGILVLFVITIGVWAWGFESWVNANRQKIPSGYMCIVGEELPGFVRLWFPNEVYLFCTPSEQINILIHYYSYPSRDEMRSSVIGMARDRSFYICGTRERQTIHLEGELAEVVSIYNSPHGRLDQTVRPEFRVYDFTIYRAIEIPTDDPDVIETWYLVGALNGPCGWTMDATLTQEI